jgi:exodeoxyribonuclease X
MSVIRIVDVESTGTDPAVDRIVEIATVDLVIGPDSRARRGDMWSTLVNPGIPIPPTASAVHHITDDMVADAPRLKEVDTRVLAGKPIFLAAHNAKFDSGFVDSCGIPWLCTYKAALRLWPDAPGYSNQCLRYWRKLKFADDVGPTHRALADAYVTAAILARMLAVAPIADLAAWSIEPPLLSKFGFGKHRGVPLIELPEDYLQWIVGKSDLDADVKWNARHELDRRQEASAPALT